MIFVIENAGSALNFKLSKETVSQVLTHLTVNKDKQLFVFFFFFFLEIKFNSRIPIKHHMNVLIINNRMTF